VLEQKVVYIQHLRYRYLAYCVIRDAIGFYFGIPKLFEQSNFSVALKEFTDQKINELQKSKNRPLEQKEIDKCTKVTEKLMASRLKELTTDYENCQDVLFTDNLWLQLLDLDSEFFKNYLPKLSSELIDELAVVPKWHTRDHSLGRPYINDNFDLTKNYF